VQDSQHPYMLKRSGKTFSGHEKIKARGKKTRKPMAKKTVMDKMIWALPGKNRGCGGTELWGRET